MAVKGVGLVDWLAEVPDCRAEDEGRSVGVGLSPRGLSRSTQSNVIWLIEKQPLVIYHIFCNNNEKHLRD